MARINIDVSNAPDPFAVAPAGTYALRVAEVSLGETKETNKPMLKVQYEIVGDDENQGKRIFDNLVLDSRFAKFRLKQLCEIAGEDPADPDTDNLVGTEFEAEVEVDETEQYGEQNRVRKIFA